MRIRHNLGCLQSQGLGCTRKDFVALCYENPEKVFGILGNKTPRPCWDSCADFAQCRCSCKYLVQICTILALVSIRTMLLQVQAPDHLVCTGCGPYRIENQKSRATALRFDALRGDIRASEGLPHARTFREYRRPVYGFLWPPRAYWGFRGLRDCTEAMSPPTRRATPKGGPWPCLFVPGAATAESRSPPEVPSRTPSQSPRVPR